MAAVGAQRAVQGSSRSAATPCASVQRQLQAREEEGRQAWANDNGARAVVGVGGLQGAARGNDSGALARGEEGREGEQRAILRLAGEDRGGQGRWRVIKEDGYRDLGVREAAGSMLIVSPS
jgi:hypothetical protein